ncbi:MAG TPA: HlyD family efflux transporter periplasmic adaptor subunit [Bacteroidota bacterium]|nr:HlyD family efflux transporter periplasmic adaptor subunit [Bacteroidota bacterium]
MKNILFGIVLCLLAGLVLNSCGNGDSKIDASGTFEAVETIVSAEASGRLMAFNVEEGQTLKAGQSIGYIDSVQLYLHKRQLETQITSVLSTRPDISKQIAALQVQLQTAERDRDRLANLLKDNAVTQKQVDDANSQVDMINKQIAAQQSSLGITTEGLNRQATPLQVQIEQTEDQLVKCRIINPVNGTVLTKYVEQFEMATPGKPLYKIADLSTIILRAYLTGDQLPRIKVGQQVTVLTDNGSGGYKNYSGTISWVSDKSEFTPKTIQTKDERANLVYAIKIDVKNDGYLKLGMYADVRF